MKAIAYEEYGHAATTKLVLDALPKLAKSISKPLQNVEDLTIIGSGTITSSNCMTQLASTNYTSTNDNALTSATNMLYNQDPLFVSSSDPDGADNIWMTLNTL